MVSAVTTTAAHALHANSTVCTCWLNWDSPSLRFKGWLLTLAEVQSQCCARDSRRLLIFLGLKGSLRRKMHKLGGVVQRVPRYTALGQDRAVLRWARGTLAWGWAGPAGCSAPLGSARLPSPRADGQLCSVLQGKRNSRVKHHKPSRRSKARVCE